MIDKQYGFDFETEKCVQCHACEVACKSSNDVELGLKWRRVVDVWSGVFPDVSTRTLSLACMHCGDPACEAVCPTGAIMKRTSDGIVLVDQKKCIGCRSCFIACPFGVPQFGANGKMQKCDLCADRLTAGQDPACVATCPANALHFGPLDELTRGKAGRVSHKLLMPYLAPS